MTIHIKHLFIILFVSIFFFGCCNDKILNLNNKLENFQSSVINFQSSTEPLQNKHIVYNTLKSTVAFTRYDQHGDKRYYCTGVFVNPTTIVSARHCVFNFEKLSILGMLFEEKFAIEQIYEETINSEIDITTRTEFENSNFDDQKAKTIKAKIVYLTTKNVGQLNKIGKAEPDDIVVLKISQKNASRYWINPSQYEPLIGDKIFSTGMHLGEPWIMTEGTLSQNFYINGNKTHYYANLLVAPGLSGGPLLNSEGQLIGIAHVMISGNNDLVSGLGLFVGLNKIKQYLSYAKSLRYDE